MWRKANRVHSGWQWKSILALSPAPTEDYGESLVTHPNHISKGNKISIPMNTCMPVCIVVFHTKWLRCEVSLGAYQQTGGKKIEYTCVMEYYSVIKRNG